MKKIEKIDNLLKQPIKIKTRDGREVEVATITLTPISSDGPSVARIDLKITTQVGPAKVFEDHFLGVVPQAPWRLMAGKKDDQGKFHPLFDYPTQQALEKIISDAIK